MTDKKVTEKKEAVVKQKITEVYNKEKNIKIVKLARKATSYKIAKLIKTKDNGEFPLEIWFTKQELVELKKMIKEIN